MKILLYLLIKVFNFIKVDSRIIFAISVCFCMEIKNYSKCCCECCEDCLEDKKSDEELEKNVVIVEEYKYDKNTIKNVSNSKYRSLDFPNVPFFSSYNTVNQVIIPFAFELGNEYFKIFPTKMKEIVRSLIDKEGIQENNVKIFFCYQYLTTKIYAKKVEEKFKDECNSINEKIFKNECNAINEEILFRPHFFIAKKEIDNYSKAENKKFIYSKAKNEKYIYSKAKNEKYIYSKAKNEEYIYSNIDSGNKCVVFNSEKENILDCIEKNFSIHGGRLSFRTPSIGIKIKETSSNVEIYYSFVLELLEKKIAAMTIHFLKCPDEGYSWENINKEIDPSKINTINDAINFAYKNKDKEVVDFLNSITK